MVPHLSTSPDRNGYYAALSRDAFGLCWLMSCLVSADTSKVLTVSTAKRCWTLLPSTASVSASASVSVSASASASAVLFCCSVLLFCSAFASVCSLLPQEIFFCVLAISASASASASISNLLCLSIVAQWSKKERKEKEEGKGRKLLAVTHRDLAAIQ